MAAETPSSGASRSAAAAQAPDASSSRSSSRSSEKPATVGIFSGLRFYISRDVAPDRRKSVRRLIEENKGAVAAQMAANDVVELVESASLRAGEKWVSVDFVFDSARDGVLRDVDEYSAFGRDAAATTATAAKQQQPGDPKRKRPYTVAEEVEMFRFLKGHLGELPKSMCNVQLSIWEMAAGQGVTTRSAQSMHEHYRKEMKQMTPTERKNLFANAEAEANIKKRSEIARANHLAKGSAAAAAASTPPPAEADAERAATTPTPAADSNARSLAGARDAGAAGAVPAERRSADDEDNEGSNATARRSPPPAPRRSPAAPSVARDAPTGFSEANFSSRWELLVNDASQRAFLQQCFDPVRVSAVPEATRESAAAAVTPATSGVPASRRRRRAEPTAPAVEQQLQQQQQEEAAVAPEETRAPLRKKRKARQHAAPSRPQAGAVRKAPRQPPTPTPPQEAVSSESEITHVVSQLQLETNQDADAIVHALFYASGDVGVAKAFLRGARPSAFWSHDDDVLLEAFVGDNTDARAVAAARRRGAFAAMRVPRTAAQILTRIRYLS